MKKTRFYVCPNCGNVVTSSSDLIMNCCGRKLAKLKANKDFDEKHIPRIETTDGEVYVSINHEMDKEHYISFIAYVTADKMMVAKLYPEQGAEARFQMTGHGILYVYCNVHGLWMKNL
jgi:desulfoferrodoxin